MSPRVLLVGLLLLLGPGCSDQGAVKLTVKLEGFKPRCVRLRVEDPENGDGTRQTKDLVTELKDRAVGDTLTVAAFRRAGWSNTLRLTAQSFEGFLDKDPVVCTGTPVDEQVNTVSVQKGERAELMLTLSALDVDGDGYASLPKGTDCDDKNAQVNPVQAELCNQVDDNCDNRKDEGFDVGASCTTEEGCVGKWTCATDQSVVCTPPSTTTLYEDGDGDTHGNPDASIQSCLPTRTGYATRAEDCDDTRLDVHPGATERCDGVDNDCDRDVDEGFNVGQACDPGLGCAGKRVCASATTTRCDIVPPLPVMKYPDEDGDGHGKSDSGTLTCASTPGLITTGGDCDDGNPFTHADAPELCDLDDNNCNSSTDELVCPGGGNWVAQPTAAENFRSVTVWGNGGVWVAGANNALRVRPPGQTAFITLDAQCTGEWFGVWVESQSGTGVLTGSDGSIKYHFPTAGPCFTGPATTNNNARGIFGLSLPDNQYEAYVVGASVSPANQGLAQWGTQTGPSFSNSASMDALYDVHGLSRELIFAVGGQTAGGPKSGARIYRFMPVMNDWKSEKVEDVPGVVDNRLRGVWVVNSRLAYAVGEDNSVLMWNGTAWSVHPAPGAGEHLLSVVAFGKNAIYVSTRSGKVFRYADGSWTPMLTLSPSRELYDIAGSSPGDLWVVGINGTLQHWPQ